MNGGGGGSLVTPVTVANGGTGISTVPANGQVPIGDGTSYVAAALTAGPGMDVAGAAGAVTLTNTGLRRQASNYASVAITNSTSELSMFSASLEGTLNLPANVLTRGRGIRITIRGNIVTDASPPSVTWRGKFGALTVATASIALPASLTGLGFEATITFVARADPGAAVTVAGDLQVLLNTSSTALQRLAAINTGAVATNGVVAMDATVQASAADVGSTITVAEAFIEVL